MNATILIMPHIGEYIADIGNFPPCSQLERQEERGGIFRTINHYRIRIATWIQASSPRYSPFGPTKLRHGYSQNQTAPLDVTTA